MEGIILFIYTSYNLSLSLSLFFCFLFFENQLHKAFLSLFAEISCVMCFLFYFLYSLLDVIYFPIIFMLNFRNSSVFFLFEKVVPLYIIFYVTKLYMNNYLNYHVVGLRNFSPIQFRYKLCPSLIC